MNYDIFKNHIATEFAEKHLELSLTSAHFQDKVLNHGSVGVICSAW